MAYADYDFYTKKYYGDAIPEADFLKFSERASDWLDVATFNRISDGLPTDEKAAVKVKKATCAAAELLHLFDLAGKQAAKAAQAGSALTDGTTVTAGLVSSVSSGSESITYMSGQQLGASAKEWNAAISAAGNPDLENKLLMDTVKRYLSGVCTDDGIPLLYAGI